MKKNPKKLVEACQNTRGLLLVVTGAGVSVASNLPTFRGTEPNAIWKQDVMELGTFEYFSRDPVGSWSWYEQRFSALRSAEPNPAHYALAALERWQLERGRPFALITQNIDTLHEDAGSEQLIKVHGTSDRVRCSADGCRLGAPRGSLPRSDAAYRAFTESPAVDLLPRCPECEALLRPHVLWFDEYYFDHIDYQWERVQELAATAETVLFVGTSFSVTVTDLVLANAETHGARTLSIDPGAHTSPSPIVELLAASAETVLPQACLELGASMLDPHTHRVSASPPNPRG